MRRNWHVIVCAALLGAAGAANAGQIWTDGDLDGLPDATPLTAGPGDTVSVDIYVDSQSFTWTGFIVFVEWDPTAISYLSATYMIVGGTNFPLDTFTHPNAVGWGGFGYGSSGVDLIGAASFRIDADPGCVEPIIDYYNPYQAYSVLISGTTSFLFQTETRTCWTESATGVRSASTQDATWGRIKRLFE